MHPKCESKKPFVKETDGSNRKWSINTEKHDETQNNGQGIHEFHHYPQKTLLYPSRILPPLQLGCSSRPTTPSVHARYAGTKKEKHTEPENCAHSDKSNGCARTRAGSSVAHLDLRRGRPGATATVYETPPGATSGEARPPVYFPGRSSLARTAGAGLRGTGSVPQEPAPAP